MKRVPDAWMVCTGADDGPRNWALPKKADGSMDVTVNMVGSAPHPLHGAAIGVKKIIQVNIPCIQYVIEKIPDAGLF